MVFEGFQDKIISYFPSSFTNFDLFIRHPIYYENIKCFNIIKFQ